MKTLSPPKSLQSIAAEWHSGQASALYAYASTGTIQPGLSREIASCFPAARPRELADLQRLYVATAVSPTRQSILNATEFWHRVLRNADGTPVRCRPSGKLQTWKTRSNDFKLPVKRGLKESFYLMPENVSDWVIAP